MAKRYILSVERNAALKEAQRYACEREMTSLGYCQCITCGAIVSDAQGGHFIPKRVRVTELVPENIHPQCVKCNMYKNGDPLMYRGMLYDLYGVEYVKRLEDLKAAYEGNQEAYESLSDEDRELVKVKRTGAWYHEQRVLYRNLRKHLKENR